ncbi:TPA: VENN motif pre-toxin domain-containing protein [Klebsiella aerogenes]|nr:VENN motif pre-toxin domain-containing protein [Klebsiella aerogenes]
MTGLSRDAAHANQTLSPIFDKEKEQNRLATAQKIGEIGRQVSDVLVTQGKLNAQAAQSDPAARAAARAKLVAGGNGSPSEEQISAQVSRTATADYDTGGKYQKVAQAVTAAMQGLAGGNLAQAASGAVSPYVAEIIHSQTTDSATGKVNVEANAMAHAVWGAIAAASGNNSALAGAAGAVSGELLGRWIAAEYYPGVKTEELSDEQKSTISALSTLAAGLMGGLSGGSSADAVAGAQAGKNAVENNYLSSTEARQLDKELSDCKASGNDCKSVVEKYIEISNKNSKELVDACSGGGIACVTWEELLQGATNVANDANASQFRLDEKLKDPEAAALVNYLNGTDLKFLQENITSGDRLLSVITDPTSWPVLVMGGKAIITNTVTNGKELLIAAGASVAGSAAIQYGVHGEVKLSDVIGAGVIGAITAGKGYNPTVTWNAAGGYYQAELKGDDPFLGALLSKAGAATGYAAGNILKVPADKIFNPVSKQYEWIPTGVWTISKPVPQSSVPSVAANVANSTVSGLSSYATSDKNGEAKK